MDYAIYGDRTHTVLRMTLTTYREIGECLGCGKQRASRIVLEARARLAAHEETGPNGFGTAPRSCRLFPE